MGREYRIDRAARVVPGPPDAVWKALTQGDQLERWLPPAGATGVVHDYDARIGGALRMTLTFPPGTPGKAGKSGKADSGRDEVVGRVVGVTMGRRLTWDVTFPADKPENAGAMRMLWTLTPAGSGTRVTVEAIDPPRGLDREEHERALDESLAQLAAVLAPA